MFKYSLLSLVLFLGLVTISCTNRAPERQDGVVAEPEGASEQAANEPGVTNDPGDEEPEPTPPEEVMPFPEREFDGTPLMEEHHRVRVFWAGDKTRLMTCKSPEEASECEAHGPILEKGQELTWKYSTFRTKPHVLTAKHDVELIIHGQSTTLSPGTQVGLYAYRGEGTCALAVGQLFDEGTNCPMADDFDGYPTAKGGTARVLAPANPTWWVERDEGWIRLHPEQIRVEFEEMVD